MELSRSLALALSVPAYLLAAYYFWRATKLGRYAAITFLTIVAYGLTVESIEILKSHEYFYTELLVMIGRSPNWVPLSIGVTWSTLLFIVMQTTDRLGLPWWQRPFVDGSIAVSLDMLNDPSFSASRWVSEVGTSCMHMPGETFGGLGVWVWCVPGPDAAPPMWYSVPMSNFTQWWVMVFTISFVLRFGQHVLGGDRRPWLAQIGLLISLCAVAGLALFGFIALYDRVFQAVRVQHLLLALALFAPLVVVVAQRKRLNFRNRFDLGLVFMPLSALASALLVFLVRGVDRAHWPLSAAVAVAVALVSATLFLSPYLGNWFGGRPDDVAAS